MAEDDDHYDDDFEAESEDEKSNYEGVKEEKDEDVTDDGWRVIDFSELELEGSRIIGGGGFAVVFKGRWKDRPVAVKTLFDPKVDAKLKKEYMDELHVMRELCHPNIVEFIGACVTPPKLCFVMELCSQSLYDLLHNSSARLEHQQLIDMAVDIAEGINYLHTKRPSLIHRDLKPHNILIDDAGVLKLCDFGLVTTRNTTAGTPNYMAPELLADKPFSKAVDVYAFGIILWEMFVRAVPFHGWRATDIKDAVTSGERPKMYELPELIESLIPQCWHSDPFKRPSMAEIIPQLRNWKPFVSAISELTIGGSGDALDDLLKM